jgi:hypothetical protein
MVRKTSKKSAKVATKAAAERVAAKPTLLAGGNPQIAKADGDAPVQADTGLDRFPLAPDNEHREYHRHHSRR